MRGRMVLLVLLSACQADSGPRWRDTDGHFSVVEPAGWTRGLEKGTTIYYADAVEGAGPHSIAIRSVPRRGDWVAERTPELVLPATRQAVLGLPAADLVAETPWSRDGLQGVLYQVSYAPPGGRGARYERQHLVWVGRERVFHVLHTAPAGELSQTADVFDAVVASLREEV
jgi:hypothetical protein